MRSSSVLQLALGVGLERLRAPSTVVCASAQSAACAPARRPYVIVSISALPPSRLAPCTDTQAHLAGGVQALERRAAPDVGVDAAHVVVGARPHRDRLVDRVDAREDHRQLAGAVQALEDLLRAEVAQVEQHVAVDAAALVDLRLLRARDDVAAARAPSRSARSA